MIESQSLVTQVALKLSAFAELVAQLTLKAVYFAGIVDEVVRRVGALGAHDGTVSAIAAYRQSVPGLRWSGSSFS